MPETPNDILGGLGGGYKSFKAQHPNLPQHFIPPDELASIIAPANPDDSVYQKIYGELSQMVSEITNILLENPTPEALLALTEKHAASEDTKMALSVLANSLSKITDINEAVTYSRVLLPVHKIMETIGARISGKSDPKFGLTDIILQKIGSELRERKATFAMPSHSIMPLVLTMFPVRHTLKEESGTSCLDESGRKILRPNFIVVDSPKIRGEVKPEDGIIGNDTLLKSIYRAYGPGGMRHFFGIIMWLDDAGRTGNIEWSVNKHLEYLGMAKGANGSYDMSEKKTAIDIIWTLAKTYLTVRCKTGKKESILGLQLLNVPAFNIETEKEYDKILNATFMLSVPDWWYRFPTKKSSALQYTKMLRRIVKEDPKLHSFVAYLSTMLAIWWRMNGYERKISVKNILEWCNIDWSSKNPNRMRDLRTLESELNYMQMRGYLGKWHGNEGCPSQCPDPFNRILTLTAPAWLKDVLDGIKAAKETQRVPSLPASSNITREEFRGIFEKSGLSQRQFADRIGISAQQAGFILGGKRKVTKKVSDKVKKVFSVNKIDPPVM